MAYVPVTDSCTSLQNFANDDYPDVQLGCVSNMYVRLMEFKQVGCKEPGHDHPFDHMTLLAKGALEVEVDGVKTKFIAPKMIFIEKDKTHSLTALEPDTLAFCIHPIRNGERIEDIIDPSMLPRSSKETEKYLADNQIYKHIVCGTNKEETNN
jgi:quercetin dioxygenase-like cupin family protein